MRLLALLFACIFLCITFSSASKSGTPPSNSSVQETDTQIITCINAERGKKYGGDGLEKCFQGKCGSLGKLPVLPAVLGILFGRPVEDNSEEGLVTQFETFRLFGRSVVNNSGEGLVTQFETFRLDKTNGCLRHSDYIECLLSSFKHIVEVSNHTILPSHIIENTPTSVFVLPTRAFCASTDTGRAKFYEFLRYGGHRCLAGGYNFTENLEVCLKEDKAFPGPNYTMYMYLTGLEKCSRALFKMCPDGEKLGSLFRESIMMELNTAYSWVARGKYWLSSSTPQSQNSGRPSTKLNFEIYFLLLSIYFIKMYFKVWMRELSL